MGDQKEDATYTERELLDIKGTIEAMSHVHQTEILQLLVKNECELSENQNGTFLNLSKLNARVLEEIREYLNYVKFQTESLREIERKKEILISKYFQDATGSPAKSEREEAPCFSGASTS